MFLKHVSTFNNLNTLYDHQNTNQKTKITVHFKLQYAI